MIKRFLKWISAQAGKLNPIKRDPKLKKFKVKIKIIFFDQTTSSTMTVGANNKGDAKKLALTAVLDRIDVKVKSINAMK